MDYSLSDADIRNYLDGRCKIISYSQLKYINNIDEIIKPYDCCIILYQEEPNYGHWVALTLNGNNLEYFDSYGGLPDEVLLFYPKRKRIELNEEYPYLTHLLINSPYELHYNQFKLQQDGPDINTCGRWCLGRILYKTVPLNDFVKIFLGSGNPDKLITKLISNI